MKVKIKTLPHYVGPLLPEYGSEFAAGFDLQAAILDIVISVEPGERVVIPTGITLEVPIGYELQIRGRSGLALKHGISITHGVGTIDSDYRGEIKVLLINHGNETFSFKRGDRIAQAVLSKYEKIQWEEVDELTDTSRGLGGFGSTGIK